MIFIGRPVYPPICNSDQLDAVRVVLEGGLIDAYKAGIPSKQRRYDWYYEGNLLAVALALSNSLAIRIGEDELNQAVALILEASAGSHAMEPVAGIEKDLRQSIAAKCYEAGYKFNFLKKIKGWSLW